jgi:hypothetical protein
MNDITTDEGEKGREKLAATVALQPQYRHAVTGIDFASRSTRWPLDEMAVVSAYQDTARDVRNHDLSAASNMLTSQALTLDAVFTDMLSRSSRNLAEYPQADERYMRLALKAQASSRATLEALIRLHQPREQIVKHVTVHEGGQAVVADQFHHHAGGKNEKSADQSRAAGSAGSIPTLSSPDPLWNGMPITSGEREEAMQDARRDEPGSAQGQ